MKYKAVIFDLFETLITEWGHKKYTKSEMCADLGIEKDTFDFFWDENEEQRYLGDISFEDSILYVCKRCGKTVDSSVMSDIVDKRVKTKSACFEYVNPEVYMLLERLKAIGLRTAIISNCSPEEVTPLKESAIYRYFDEVVLSCDIHMKKPDSCIYEEAARRLGVTPGECLYVGDGGSDELPGARDAGMTAVQAKWYTDQMPYKRGDIEGFLTAEEPLGVMEYIK